MQELIKLAVGIGVLILGIPAGNLLALKTKEELKSGQKWFKIILILSLVGSISALIFWQDYLLFSLLFIAIVASRSLKR